MAKKKFVVLIDPDKVRLGKIQKVLEMSVEGRCRLFFYWMKFGC